MISHSFVFWLVILLFSPLSEGKQNNRPPSLSSQIDRLITKHKLNKSQLGLVILKRADSHYDTVYKLNDKKLFTPASLTKIATLSASYHYYPRDFKFKSELLLSGHIQDQKAKGDLYFKGGGDPSFTTENLHILISDFVRKTGVNHIEGDIVIDNSLFQKNYFLSHKVDSYEAPVSSASFNWNSVAFYVEPTQNKSLARVTLSPKNTFIGVVNKVQTNLGKKSRISVKRIKQSSQREVFQLEGFIGDQSKEKIVYSNIQAPSFWLGHNIKSFLNKEGVTVKGRIKKGSCSSCKSMAYFENRTLKFHAHNMMKYSNNFVARMLALNLPLTQNFQKGSLQKGVSFINKYLKNIVKLKGFRFVEPSGLDTRNKFSPHHFQKILLKDFSSFYDKEIFTAYPIVGEEGTFQRDALKGLNIRAKTGTLYKASALSGYAINSSHEQFVFTFIFNGPHSKTELAREFFDKILLILAR